jgi:hypothetical protein
MGQRLLLRLPEEELPARRLWWRWHPEGDAARMTWWRWRVHLGGTNGAPLADVRLDEDLDADANEREGNA